MQISRREGSPREQLTESSASGQVAVPSTTEPPRIPSSGHQHKPKTQSSTCLELEKTSLPSLNFSFIRAKLISHKAD
jgi:hypothetical protein